eukprot:TRINITY_DN11661_c0_g1_i2.p1 TRINITY_DN11661_c0_g1~~TRINITY_DN11661_c0_g1_i2.p1  ORF type:complete len:636 (+),score=205.85 TRINITY_DN11661_c0_g1_i2:103-2010(+)
MRRPARPPQAAWPAACRHGPHAVLISVAAVLGIVRRFSSTRTAYMDQREDVDFVLAAGETLQPPVRQNLRRSKVTQQAAGTGGASGSVSGDAGVLAEAAQTAPGSKLQEIRGNDAAAAAVKEPSLAEKWNLGSSSPAPASPQAAGSDSGKTQASSPSGKASVSEEAVSARNAGYDSVNLKVYEIADDIGRIGRNIAVGLARDAVTTAEQKSKEVPGIVAERLTKSAKTAVNDAVTYAVETPARFAAETRERAEQRQAERRAAAEEKARLEAEAAAAEAEALRLRLAEEEAERLAQEEAAKREQAQLAIEEVLPGATTDAAEAGQVQENKRKTPATIQEAVMFRIEEIGIAIIRTPGEIIFAVIGALALIPVAFARFGALLGRWYLDFAENQIRRTEDAISSAPATASAVVQARVQQMQKSNERMLEELKLYPVMVISKTSQAAAQAAGDKAQEVATTIVSIPVDAASAASTAVTRRAEEIKEAVVATPGQIVEEIKRTPDNLAHAAETSASKTSEALKAALEDAVQGVQRRRDDAIRQVEQQKDDAIRRAQEMQEAVVAAPGQIVEDAKQTVNRQKDDALRQVEEQRADALRRAEEVQQAVVAAPGKIVEDAQSQTTQATRRLEATASRLQGKEE